MAYCPNCGASIVLTAESCGACGALLTGDGWRPVEEKPQLASNSLSASFILVSIFNYLGFLLYLIGGLVADTDPAGRVSVVIATVICFLWLGAFTVNGMRHADDLHYPVAATTALAWPSFLVTAFTFLYVANLLGFKLT
jgi:hypothetical protein